MKIGLVYIKGSTPGFEDYGNLPTNLVKSNGLVNGVKASKELDGIIIPGGSIVESESISEELAIEIKKIANDGKFVIGICSGFQSLALKTAIGKKSPCPTIKKGLGLLDARFSPLINNDRVEVKIENKSFLTKNIDKSEMITGFHSHTYGHIKGEATPIFYSSVKRLNYSDVEKNKKQILSGVTNDDENVVGTMIHGLLDENPILTENIFDFLGASPSDIDKTFKSNEKLKKVIKSELAIDSGINLKNSQYCTEFKKLLFNSMNKKFTANNLNNLKDETYSSEVNSPKNKSYSTENNVPPCLMIGSTGSDSGKTFITTGIAGALTKRGLNVLVLKVGPDIRDLHPSLYLTKGKVEDFSSIKIGHLGWMDIENILKRLKNSNYDFVLIEGVMSVFTGLLNEKIPYSASEIAISSNIPMLLTTAVNKGGIESAAIDMISHAKTLKNIGVAINGILLNKVYDMDIFEEVATLIKENLNLNPIAIPKIKMDEESTNPEVEIKLEEFSIAALNTVEKYIDMEEIINMAAIPEFNGYLSLDEIKSILKDENSF
ncbi:MAG: cobyrinic acid a,c-diamide synthase [Methanobrevibacter sp.]|nr:cobyrinic acid a,c-diamide synthase [Methanobrevibacter sp.]